MNSHYRRKNHSCHECGGRFITKSSVGRHRKTCKGSDKTKALLESTQHSNQPEDDPVIEVERFMSETVTASEQFRLRPPLAQPLSDGPPFPSTPAADPEGSSALSNVYRPPEWHLNYFSPHAVPVQPSQELGTFPPNLPDTFSFSPHLLQSRLRSSQELASLPPDPHAHASSFVQG